MQLSELQSMIVDPDFRLAMIIYLVAVVPFIAFCWRKHIGQRSTHRHPRR